MSEESPRYVAGGTSAYGHPPRMQDVCFAHLAAAKHYTPLTDAVFARNLASAYLRLVPKDMRSLDIPDIDALYEAGDSDAHLSAIDSMRKRVARYKDGSLYLPMELLEAWIAALPAPYGMQCARAIARRFGFLGASAPELDAGPVADLSSVSAVADGAAQSTALMAKMLADGRYDVGDAEDAPAAVRALRNQQAQIESVIALICERCDYDEQGRPHG